MKRSTSSGSFSAVPLEDAPSMAAECKAEALESVGALEGSFSAFKTLSMEFEAHLNWKGKAG